MSYLEDVNPIRDHETICLGSAIYGISHPFVQV